VVLSGMKINTLVILFIVFILSFSVSAEITVMDEAGQLFTFDRPVKRIISLAPHITETLFSAGATNQVIATVTYSDYPEQARSLPVIGDHSKYDLEAIIKLNPELIVSWKSGNPIDQIQQLKKLGFKIFVTDPYALKDIAKNIKSMGLLMGTESVADLRAEKYLNELNDLALKYKNKKRVSVFYQVWNEPLITINKKHIINHVINLCGGRNVFENLSVLAPRVSIESVFMKNPDAIVTGMAEGRENWLNSWQQWVNIKAVEQGHLFAINADWIVRHTPRILLGAGKMCDHLEKVRSKL
jgi:iron complex transport system substrate-binding protein